MSEERIINEEKEKSPEELREEEGLKILSKIGMNYESLRAECDKIREKKSGLSFSKRQMLLEFEQKYFG